ncbi:prohead core protein [Shigella phage vB_SdyM_006]|nr:prohead core protein [Shigella phage vB_SdyM_006]
MEDIIVAIKNKDLVEVKKLFSEAMKERTLGLIEAEKLKICQNIFVEGEESDKDDSDDKEKDVKDTKKDKDDKDAE